MVSHFGCVNWKPIHFLYCLILTGAERFYHCSHLCLLAFFEQPLDSIAPKTASDYFGLDVRFAEFDPPDNQEGFLDYMDNLPDDIHVGNPAQLRIYHEWQ